MSFDLKKELIDSYKQVGIFSADIIYIYSDFRTFGMQMGDFSDREAFCRAFVEPLLTRGKTILLTTFSYTTSGRFDTLTTPTYSGAMNKWILKQEEVIRSEHPLFSYAAIGPRAELIQHIGKTAFGRDSVFDRLRGQNTSFLYIGRPVSLGNTLLHHIEHLSGATYRIHKAFPTEVYRGEEFIGTNYTAFIRRRDVETETFAFEFSKATQQLWDRGLIRQTGSDQDYTNISCLSYDHTADCLFELFSKDPTIFIKSDFIQY